MMGAFPPPVGGSAKISEIIFESLSAAGVDVTKIDLSANNLSHRRNIVYPPPEADEERVGPASRQAKG